MDEKSDQHGVRRVPRRGPAAALAATLAGAVAAAALGVAAGSAAAGAVSAVHRPDRGSSLQLGAALGERGRQAASTGVTSAARGAREATDAERVGVVDIDTVLEFGPGEASATGMVLPSGDVLTNNHVVERSTAIRVTDVVSGRAFTGTVLGTAPSEDVAVIRLSGASGLTPARFTTSPARIGAAVTAVGNAGGAGGTPTATSGSLVALDQQITATDENGENPEQLNGMIQVDAQIRAGDSGGPLYSGDVVIGMTTAASVGGRRTTPAGFAIPIDTATAVADRIRAGESSDTIHQGTRAFLGIRLGAAASGPATIAGVIDGFPAAAAGLRDGDTITALGGTSVDTPAALSAAIAAHRAGDQVEVAWTDAGGASRIATVTLASGPAD